MRQGMVLRIARKQGLNLAERMGSEVAADCRRYFTRDELAEKYVPDIYERDHAAGRAVIGVAIKELIPDGEREAIGKEVKRRSGIRVRDEKLGHHSDESHREVTLSRGETPYDNGKHQTPFGEMTEGDYAFLMYQLAMISPRPYGLWVQINIDHNNVFGNNRSIRALRKYCRIRARRESL